MSRLVATVFATALFAAGEVSLAATVRSAWDYRSFEVDPGALFSADCSSPQGRLLVMADESHLAHPRSRVAVLISSEGKAQLKTFPPLPNGAGMVAKSYACRWLDEGSLLVLAETDQDSFGAIWLDTDFTITAWLEIQGRHADVLPTAIGETRPGEFVAVGTGLLQPIAYRFDRRQAEPVRLPWVPDPPQGAARYQEPDPQGMLRDVVPDQRGGFVVCGIEASAAGRSTPSSEVIVATFDESASMSSMARFGGRTCALLPGRSGNVRLLRDDYAIEHSSLLLTTLSPTLEPVSEESLMTRFAPVITFAAFESQDASIVFASPWFAWETLEIRGPSSRDSFDLDLDPGGFIDILPGPSRVYVVSSARRTERKPGESVFGLRVDALDIQTTSP
jgi:hypothetical protein